MASSTRIYGKQLGLEVDGEDYWQDTISCVMKNEDDGDTVVTFYDASVGDVKKYYFEVTAVQSTDATSFWSFCYDNVGVEVPFQYAVHGNASPSANQPHVIGNLTVTAPPELGGEAGRKKQQTFTMRLDIVGTPTLDRTP